MMTMKSLSKRTNQNKFIQLTPLDLCKKPSGKARPPEEQDLWKELFKEDYALATKNSLSGSFY